MKLTDYLAIYGAILSTMVFVWNTVKSRAKIKVRLTHALDTEGDKSRFGLGISVQNPSSHTAHITSACFLYQYTKPTISDRVSHLREFRRLPLRLGWASARLSLYDVEDGCPVTIEPNKSHWIFVPEEAVKTVLAKAKSPYIRVQVQDELWRNELSAKFRYKI